MNKDEGRLADATGLSQVEPASAVSPLRASIPSADAFIRAALKAEITAMLAELGNPPLVDRIYPQGWGDRDRAGLIDLYELCRRTFNQRGQSNG